MNVKTCDISNRHCSLKRRLNYTYHFTHIKIKVCFPSSNCLVIRIHNELDYVVSNLNEVQVICIWMYLVQIWVRKRILMLKFIWFRIFTEMFLKIQIFWNLEPFWFLNIYRRFEGNTCFYFAFSQKFKISTYFHCRLLLFPGLRYAT
jgi:hypothetical protein